MSLGHRVASDHQLARLLQIGIVLEEVVEARAAQHARRLDEPLDPEIEDLLDHAAEESAEHRERLEALIDGLEAESVPFGEIEELVAEHYEADADFDGVLYDQLASEETAYKFYDDLVEAIEGSDVAFSIDREHLVRTLVEIREEEAEGVERVTTLMETRA